LSEVTVREKKSLRVLGKGGVGCTDPVIGEVTDRVGTWFKEAAYRTSAEGAAK